MFVNDDSALHCIALNWFLFTVRCSGYGCNAKDKNGHQILNAIADIGHHSGRSEYDFKVWAHLANASIHLPLIAPSCSALAMRPINLQLFGIINRFYGDYLRTQTLSRHSFFAVAAVQCQCEIIELRWRSALKQHNVPFVYQSLSYSFQCNRIIEGRPWMRRSTHMDSNLSLSLALFPAICRRRRVVCVRALCINCNCNRTYPMNECSFACCCGPNDFAQPIQFVSECCRFLYNFIIVARDERRPETSRNRKTSET